MNFGGNWWTGAALVAVLANVYIFYGFESAGDISEETVERAAPGSQGDAQRAALRRHRVVRARARACCSRRPRRVSAASSTAASIRSFAGFPAWLQDFFFVMVIVAFFSCGTAVQGAGARVAFALARDGALPFSDWIKRISPRHRTPANAILIGTIVPFLFLLLVLINPSKPFTARGSTIRRTSTRSTRWFRSRRPASTSHSC